VFGSFQDYDDETMWNYEIGAKASFGNITVNTAAFYSDIEDLQATLDAGSCSSRISFNVPESHSVGIELEVAAEVTDNLYMSFAGSVIEAEFDSTVTDANGNTIGGIEKGNRLASVPELQFAVSGTYTFEEGLFNSEATYISASWAYIGDRITQPSDQVSGAGNFSSGLTLGGATGSEVTTVDLELDAYSTINLNAGFIYGDMEAVVFIKNLADENADLSFDRERGGRARLAFRTNEPRTMGVTVRKSF